MLDFYREGEERLSARIAATAFSTAASQKVAIDGQASEGTSFRA